MAALIHQKECEELSD